jgi:hypothetical protein
MIDDCNSEVFCVKHARIWKDDGRSQIRPGHPRICRVRFSPRPLAGWSISIAGRDSPRLVAHDEPHYYLAWPTQCTPSPSSTSPPGRSTDLSLSRRKPALCALRLHYSRDDHINSAIVIIARWLLIDHQALVNRSMPVKLAPKHFCFFTLPVATS